jgi:Ni,Fe-hydrogenase III small subunit
MAMYGVRKDRVLELVEAGGCRLLDVEANSVAGPQWTSYRYAVTRPGGS